MVVEIAQILIDPSKAVEFIVAVEKAKPVFLAAAGCHGVSLEQQVEDPGCFYLRVEWNSVEDHMVTFRESEGFQRWRALAGPFFVSPPVVRHAQVVGRSG